MRVERTTGDETDNEDEFKIKKVSRLYKCTSTVQL